MWQDKNAPIKLNSKEVVKAAYERFKAGTLQAQNVEDGVTTCSYSDRRGFPCGVGAGMSPEDIALLKKKHKNTASTTRLIEGGVVYVTDEGADGRASDRLRTLQAMHDDAIIFPRSRSALLEDLGRWLETEASA